jgi:FtsH-binding integral membrane protein
VKAIYEKTALGLMTVAVFCILFALTLANPDEVGALIFVGGVSVGLSMWLLGWVKQ